MMKTKRILSALLSLVMVFALLPTTAFAASPEARWGPNTNYSAGSGTLLEAKAYALSHSASDVYVQLLDNVQISATMSFISGTSLSLDLNGHTIRSEPLAGGMFHINAPTLTLTDSSAAQTGTIIGETTDVFTLFDGTSFAMDSGSILTTTGCAIRNYTDDPGESITISQRSGGTTRLSSQSATGTVALYYTGSSLNITGGTVENTRTGGYAAYISNRLSNVTVGEQAATVGNIGPRDDTPYTLATTVYKTSQTQKSVQLLFSNHTALSGALKVYESAAAIQPMTGVTAAITTWPNAALTADGDDLAPGTYYISFKSATPYQESGRLAITVAPYSNVQEAVWGDTAECTAGSGAFSAAITYANTLANTAYIRLTNNAVVPDGLPVLSGSLVLDLNGFGMTTTTTSDYMLYYAGILGKSFTITDGSQAKSGNIFGGAKGVIYMQGRGKLIVNDGLLSNSGYRRIIENATNVEINGGELSCPNSKAVTLSADASFTMNGGSVYGKDNGVYCGNSNSTVTITGGTISAESFAAIDNGGRINISQASGNTTRISTASTTKGAITASAPGLNITGGIVENTAVPEGWSVYCGDQASLSITGATVGRIGPKSPALTTADAAAQKTSPQQQSVSYALTNASANKIGTYLVYASEGATTPLADVTASVSTWPELILSSSGSNLAAGTYYVANKYDLYEESERLALTVNAPAGMSVTIRLSPTDTLNIAVELTDSIENIKAKIQEQMGYAPDRQLLSYNGTLLAEGKTLSDYDIANGAVLDLTITYSVTLNLTKDGSAYNGQTVTIQAGSGASYTLTEGTNGAYTAAVPSGTYTIYKGGVSTQKTVTVSNSGGSATLNFFTVSFNTNGGTPGPDDQSVISDGLVTAPTVVTKGTNTLSGWYSDAALTEPWTFATSKVMAAATLYAKWTSAPPAPTYTATVTPDGKTFTVQAAVYDAVTPEIFTITNTGAGILDTLNAVLTGIDAASFTLDDSGLATSLAASGTTTFTVKPNNGLTEGTYTANIEVTATGMTKIIKNVSVTVSATPPSALTGMVAITGTEKFGETLTADTTGITNNAGILSYRWKRGLTDIGSNSNTYTLAEADIGHAISCEVTSSLESGSITSAATNLIARADGPSAPSGLTGIKPTSAGGSDGKITGTTALMEYASDSSFTSPRLCSAPETSGLTAGVYYVRVKATTTHEAGAWAAVAIAAYSAPSGGGSSSGSDSSSPPAYDVPVSGSVNNMNATATVSSGTATITVNETSLDTLLNDPATNGNMKIEAGLNKNIDNIQIPAMVIEKVAKAANDGEKAITGLTVTLDSATVELDAAALTSVVDQASGSTVAIHVGEVTQTALNSQQLEAMAGEHADNLIVEITISDGNAAITDYQGGKITVTTPYTLKEGEQADNVCVWHLARDGSLTLMECSYDEAAQTVSFVTGHLSVFIVGYAERAEIIQPPLTEIIKLPFNDVKDGDWFYDAVQYMFEAGLMRGTGTAAFAPHENTTRAMIVTILYNLEKAPAVSGSPFDDVNPGQYYAGPIAWAAQNGIINGYDNGKFGPDDAITREQMAAILMNYAEYKGYDLTAAASADLSKYTDTSEISLYALDAMRWANSYGFIQGTSATTLEPQGRTTRAQVAAILQGFCGKFVRE